MVGPCLSASSVMSGRSVMLVDCFSVMLVDCFSVMLVDCFSVMLNPSTVVYFSELISKPLIRNPSSLIILFRCSIFRVFLLAKFQKPETRTRTGFIEFDMVFFFFVAILGSYRLHWNNAVKYTHEKERVHKGSQTSWGGPACPRIGFSRVAVLEPLGVSQLIVEGLRQDVMATDWLARMCDRHDDALS